MSQLNNKVVIITGGAAGIGAAMVERFRAEGANVISTDINAELGTATASKFGATFFEHDVGDPKQWEQIFAHVKKEYGRLNVIINNAGVITAKSIEDVDMETWNRVLMTNVTGVMLGSQGAIDIMKDNPEGPIGSIINITSTSAYSALPGDVGYSTSKGAVRIMTKSIAAHCGNAGYQIRCNSIAPGATSSSIVKGAIDQHPELGGIIANMSPLRRIADCSEITGMAVFLASDDASYVTGADLVVDGGLTATHRGY